MVQQATTLGLQRIAVMYQDDGFGQAGLEGVRKALAKRNLPLLLAASYERNTDKVEDAARRIKDSDAQAVIMISVFSGFITSEAVIIKSFGLGLALGVLFDAFVVRMLLMPALMHLLGGSAWWLPRWLERVVPNVDVEGSALERRHPGHHSV